MASGTPNQPQQYVPQSQAQIQPPQIPQSVPQQIPQNSYQQPDIYPVRGQDIELMCQIIGAMCQRCKLLPTELQPIGDLYTRLTYLTQLKQQAQQVQQQVQQQVPLQNLQPAFQTQKQ